MPVPKDAPLAADAAIEPPAAHVVLEDTPIHQHMTWLLDVIGRRQGVVDITEINEHWDPRSVHGPVAIRLLLDDFREWGRGSSSAYVESIEVDDPTYLRAHVLVGDKRWRVILSLNESSMKINFLKRNPEKTTSQTVR
jgi:hypothetical protein